MGYKTGQFSFAIAAQKHKEEELIKQSAKMESITLKEMGKYSAFKEVFEGIPLEEQDFSYINSNDDIKSNNSFVEGRKFGFVLIKNGFSKENYNKYVSINETKHR